MPLEALYPTISEQIVPPMAVAEAQGVILYFFSLVFFVRSPGQTIQDSDLKPLSYDRKFIEGKDYANFILPTQCLSIMPIS